MFRRFSRALILPVVPAVVLVALACRGSPNMIQVPVRTSDTTDSSLSHAADSRASEVSRDARFRVIDGDLLQDEISRIVSIASRSCPSSTPWPSVSADEFEGVADMTVRVSLSEAAGALAVRVDQLHDLTADGYFVESRYRILSLEDCSVMEYSTENAGGVFEEFVRDPGTRSGVGIHPVLGQRRNCEDAAHGFACMYAQTRECTESTSSRSSGSLSRVYSSVASSRWYDGPVPPLQIPSVWLLSELNAGDRDDVDVVIRAPDVPRPMVVLEEGSVLAARMPVRVPAFVFVISDGTRHRWVGHSRACLLGGEIFWLAAGDGMVAARFIGSTVGPELPGTGGIALFDVVSGELYRLSGEPGEVESSCEDASGPCSDLPGVGSAMWSALRLDAARRELSSRGLR